MPGLRSIYGLRAPKLTPSPVKTRANVQNLPFCPVFMLPAGGKMTAAVARLELLNVTKRYPGVIANDDVSLSVLPGEIHAILGENGAGKST